MIEEKFKKGDYIINRSCHDMAVYDKVDKKGYMHFKHYYDNMFKKMKDVKNYTLQINYQKFWHLCTDEEKKQMDELLSKDSSSKHT